MEFEWAVWSLSVDRVELILAVQSEAMGPGYQRVSMIKSPLRERWATGS